MTHLTDPAYWGREISDERYLVVSGTAAISERSFVQVSDEGRSGSYARAFENQVLNARAYNRKEGPCREPRVGSWFQQREGTDLLTCDHLVT